MPGQTSSTPASDAKLTLSTLGDASLSYVSKTDGVTAVLGPGKPLALLAYLVRSPNRTAARDHLLGLLWGDHTRDAARHALRQTIWYIRQRLGNSAIESGEGAVRFAARIDCDAEQFESAVNAGDFDRAIELYRGSFFPELSVPGGVEFDRWVDRESSRLQSLFFRSAEVLVRRWLSRGKFQEAESLARTVCETGPDREAGWRLLLECLVSAGDSVRATVEAEELQRYLEAEGKEPEPATVESIAIALDTPADDSATAAAHSLATELVGREREFSSVIRSWERCRTGRGEHILITAAAGLGKTRLLSDAHTRLHAIGAPVVHLRANPGEKQIAYSFAANLSEALAALPGSVAISRGCAATLVALNPRLSARFSTQPESMREHELPRRRTVALSELLEAVADEQPVALLVDDLHWIDAASMTVLCGLAGRVSDFPVLLLTATRPIREPLLRETATERLNLQPLTEEQIGALVNSIASLGGAPWCDELPRQLLGATQGSPLLVIETLLLALDRGWLVLEADGWSCNDELSLTKELESGGALRQRVGALGRGESWILLLLAVAGAPVELERLAQLTGKSAKLLAEDITDLEQRGFLTRYGTEVAPAHDEIADLSIELVPDDAINAANGAVGRVLAAGADGDIQKLTLAGQFLLRAGDTPRLRGVFRRCVWSARKKGDSRNVRDIAIDLVGAAGGAKEVQGLIRSLPIPMRLGLTSEKRIITAATLCVLAVLTIGWVTLTEPTLVPDAHLVLVEFPRGAATNAVSVPVRSETLDSDRPLQVRSAGVSLPALRFSAEVTSLVPNPGGNSWVASMVSPDSGGLDLYLIGPDGTKSRLTEARGDDASPSWSPDGRKLVFQTCRWNALCKYDLALLDVESGQVNPLVVGDTTFDFPKWSPWGERIAYQATTSDGSQKRICWVSVDGRLSNCHTPSNSSAAYSLAGWLGRNELLVFAIDGEERRIEILELRTGTFTMLQSPALVGAAGIDASADGEWLAARVSAPTNHASAWDVFQPKAPERSRRVVFQTAPSDKRPMAFWESNTRGTTYLETVTLQKPEIAIPLNAPYVLTALGMDATGDTIPLPMLSWRTADSAILTVDDGKVMPHAAGTATVVASAGGWREDSVIVHIGRSMHEVAMIERWAQDSLEGWRPYGTPQPITTIGPEGVPAFWNRGDGSFRSGAYSEHTLNGENGVGIDIMLSAPITLDRWQTLSVRLSPNIDVETLGDSAHQTGSLPGEGDLGTCGFELTNAYSISANESWHNDAVRVLASDNSRDLVLNQSIRSGMWHRFQLQLFPDGSCGLAIDQTPVSFVTGSINPDSDFRVMLQGNSFQTQMLHGPLEVWTGVKGDIDWRVLAHEHN